MKLTKTEKAAVAVLFASGEPIPAGTVVRVDNIEGVKAFVSPAEVPARV